MLKTLKISLPPKKTDLEMELLGRRNVHWTESAKVGSLLGWSIVSLHHPMKSWTSEYHCPS